MSDFGRLVRGLTAFNYIRSMGRVVLFQPLRSCIGVRPSQGVGRFMSQGVPALLSAVSTGVKLSVQRGAACRDR
jgi:hypothetical protein